MEEKKLSELCTQKGSFSRFKVCLDLLLSDPIVNVEKSFHSYTELPGKCPSIRLLEKQFSRKKTSNFYLESKIKSLHVQARVSAIFNTFRAFWRGAHSVAFSSPDRVICPSYATSRAHGTSKSFGDT